MKRFLILSVALIASLHSTVSANYYNVLNTEMGYDRSPFGSQQTLDSDFRLRGMGFLSLPIRDESNEIGVFKYGGFAAGVPLDYKFGKSELYYYGDWGTVEDKAQVTSNFVGDQADITNTGAQFMFATPFKCGGALAFNKNWQWNEFETTSGAGNATGFLPDDTKDSLRDFNIAYGHQLGSKWLAGLSIEHRLDRTTDEVGFLGNVFKSDTRQYRMEVSPSIGYRWDLNDTNRLVIVGGPRFHNWETKSTSQNENDLDGMKIGAGVLLERMDMYRLGVFFDDGEIDGDEEFNGARVGSREIGRTIFNVRGDYFLPNKPFSFGFLYESRMKTEEAKNNAGALTEDVEDDSTVWGLGAAYYFGDKRGLLGVEYRMLKEETSDDGLAANPNDNREVKGNQLSIGTEWALWDHFRIRGGLRGTVLSSDPEGATFEEADYYRTELTLGGDYRFKDRWEAGFAYVRTLSEQDGVFGVQEDLDFTANSLQLIVKHRFGGGMTAIE